CAVPCARTTPRIASADKPTIRMIEILLIHLSLFRRDVMRRRIWTYSSGETVQRMSILLRTVAVYFGRSEFQPKISTLRQAIEQLWSVGTSGLAPRRGFPGCCCFVCMNPSFSATYRRMLQV